MRSSFVGALLAAGLVIAVTAARSLSQQPAAQLVDAQSRAGGGDLIAFVMAGDSQVPAGTITVVDPRQRVLAVYHVDRSTGQITLKSSRNITWDLQMIEYNSGIPKPEDIRSGLQR